MVFSRRGKTMKESNINSKDQNWENPFIVEPQNFLDKWRSAHMLFYWTGSGFWRLQFSSMSQDQNQQQRSLLINPSTVNLSCQPTLSTSEQITTQTWNVFSSKFLKKFGSTEPFKYLFSFAFFLPSLRFPQHQQSWAKSWICFLFLWQEMKRESIKIEIKVNGLKNHSA